MSAHDYGAMTDTEIKLKLAQVAGLQIDFAADLMFVSDMGIIWNPLSCVDHALTALNAFIDSEAKASKPHHWNINIDMPMQQQDGVQVRQYRAVISLGMAPDGFVACKLDTHPARAISLALMQAVER